MKHSATLARVSFLPAATLDLKIEVPIDAAFSRFLPFRQAFPQREQRFLEIDSGFYFSGTGLAVNRNNRMIPEHMPFRRPRISENEILWHKFKSVFAHSNPWPDESLIFFSPREGWVRNYFHFHVDQLARAVAFKHWGPEGTEFVMVGNNVIPRRQREILAALDIQVRNYPKLQPEWNNTFRFNRGVFMDSHRTGGSPGLPKDLLDLRVLGELSQQVAKVVSQYRPTSARKILISRQNALKRRIINFQDLQALLEHRGFETVELETMSWSDQVMLFSCATDVVGMHGSGLTNLLHSKEARVLEFHSLSHGVRPDYYQVSQVNRNIYTGIVYPPLDKNNDIKVSLDEVEEWLDSQSLQTSKIQRSRYFE